MQLTAVRVIHSAKICLARAAGFCLQSGVRFQLANSGVGKLEAYATFASRKLITGFPEERRQSVNQPAAPLPLADVKSLIRGTGLRSTAARVAVIQQLASCPMPQSHSEVTESLENFGFDQSTIYRCLTELSESGLVARLDLGDSIRRYELLQSGSDGFTEHPHFMCVDCGEISCLESHTFRLTPKTRGEKSPGQVVEVLLKGHCSKCQAEGQGST